MDIFHWISVGAISMALIYILFQFFHLRFVEQFYFAAYVLFVLISILGMHFFKSLETETETTLYYISATVIPVFSFIANFMLMRKLLDLKAVFPKLDNSIGVIIVILSLYIAVSLLLLTVFDKPEFVFRTYDLVRVLLIIFSVFAAVIILKKSDMVAKYFLTGLLIYLAGGTITTVMHIMERMSDNSFGALPVYFYRTGVLFQILFFSFGVNRKILNTIVASKMAEEKLLKEIYQKELEKQQALEAERERISNELHDDLGSGLTSIKFMSEILKIKLGETTESLRISNLANELIESMRHIVWTMKEEHNTLFDLLYMIKNYSYDYLEMNKITCTFDFPEKVRDIRLSGATRRTILLVIKECHHNIVKHSAATQVEISASIDDNINIHIKDNGKGILNGNDKSFGSGLNNMKKRLDEINGSLCLSNENGTLLRIKFPVS